MRRRRWYETRALLEASLELALAHDLHRAALRAYNNLDSFMWTSDALGRESLTLLERALELARRVGDRTWEAGFLGRSILSLSELGRWDEALARAAEVEELATTEFTQSFLVATVPIHCERGAPEEARRLFARLDAVGRSTNPDHVGLWAVSEARLLRTEGRPQEALAAAERALAVYAETGAGPRIGGLFEALEAAATLDDADALRTQLARLDALPQVELTPFLQAQQARFRARLEPGDADALFETAERLLAELERPFDLAVAQLEHAERLSSDGRPEDTEPLLAEAREIFERLGAKPWLERVTTADPQQQEQVPA